MYYDYDGIELKPYKGFSICKLWRVDSDGKRIKKYPYIYTVYEGEDAVGEEYNSLAEAKKFIDKIFVYMTV